MLSYQELRKLAEIIAEKLGNRYEKA